MSSTLKTILFTTLTQKASLKGRKCRFRANLNCTSHFEVKKIKNQQKNGFLRKNDFGFGISNQNTCFSPRVIVHVLIFSAKLIKITSLKNERVSERSRRISVQIEFLGLFCEVIFGKRRKNKKNEKMQNFCLHFLFL